MVPMMEVRRKFLAGTISVLSLECHSSFIRLDRWSREVVAAIVNVLDKSNGGSDEGREETENQLKGTGLRKARRGGENESRMKVRGGRENVGRRCYLRQPLPLLFLRHPNQHRALPQVTRRCTLLLHCDTATVAWHVSYRLHFIFNNRSILLIVSFFIEYSQVVFFLLIDFYPPL